MKNSRSLGSTGENVLVAIIAIGLIVFLLVTVGFENAKQWLFSPLVWDDPKGFSIALIEKEETTNWVTLTFSITNQTVDEISSGEFWAIVDGNYLSFYVPDRIKPFSERITEVDIGKDGSRSGFFKAVSGKQVWEIHPEYHVEYLSYPFSAETGERSYQANTWLKPLVLLVLSGILCFLGLSGKVKFLPLRILFKLAGVPALLIVIVILAGGASKGTSSNDSVEEDRQRRASEEYKRQAGFKAAAEQRGDRESAARAQRGMDKAMADMVGGNSNAAQRYKQYASYKAGAAMTGRTGDAARAQAQMDKAMADMIRETKKGE